MPIKKLKTMISIMHLHMQSEVGLDSCIATMVDTGFVIFISTVAATGKKSYSYVLSKLIFGMQPYFYLPRRNMTRRLDSNDRLDNAILNQH